MTNGTPTNAGATTATRPSNGLRNTTASDVDRANLGNPEYHGNQPINATNVGSLSVHTGSGNDTVYVRNNEPKLDGSARSVLIRTGGGNDIIDIRPSRGALNGSAHGGSGNDQFVLNAPAPGTRLTLQGDAGRDTLIVATENYRITPLGNGSFDLVAANGARVTLVGIEKIQVNHGRTMMSEVMLGELNSIAPNTPLNHALADYGIMPGG